MNDPTNPVEQLRALMDAVLTGGPDRPVHIRAKQSKASQLTIDKFYRVQFQQNPISVYYIDDIDIPTTLSASDYFTNFHYFQAGPDWIANLEQVKRHEFEGHVRELVGEINTFMSQVKTFEPGDIVTLKESDADGHAPFPMVVAKMLTREEQLRCSHAMGTISVFDVLVFHHREILATTVVSSRSIEKVGSLGEWGIQALIPNIISSLSVFEDPKKT